MNGTSSTYESLRDRWTEKHQESKTTIWEKHSNVLQWLQDVTHPKKLVASSLSSLLLLAMPSGYIASMPHPIASAAVVQTKSAEKIIVDGPLPPKVLYTPASLMQELSLSLPTNVKHLTTDQENAITQTLSTYFNMPVTAQIEDIRLNTNYGYIGAEQHLPLYPGDTIDSHIRAIDGANDFAASGITPGRGAWGYFAPSENALTQDDVLREKYYIAVPTFMAPGYNENTNKYYNFFKYREVLVVNPDNGKAIVADIADSGPAQFTGKQLGGSPEVMHYLNRVDGSARGSVLYFFINGTAPLGPIDIVNKNI